MAPISSSFVANGEALAISVATGETRVLKHFQERMPYGLFVPDVREEPLAHLLCCQSGALTQSGASFPPMRVLETPPLSDSGGVFAFDEHLTMAQRCKKAPASRPGLQECSIDLRDGSPLDGPNLFQSEIHTMAFQKIVVGVQKNAS
jgi:hypothetical protein